MLSNRVIYRVRDIHRGDIIVFDPPESLHSDVPFVKRVVGLPGDTVEVQRRQVLVNGSPYDVVGAAVPHYTYGPARSRPAACSSWATTGTTPWTPTNGTSSPGIR